MGHIHNCVDVDEGAKDSQGALSGPYRLKGQGALSASKKRVGAGGKACSYYLEFLNLSFNLLIWAWIFFIGAWICEWKLDMHKNMNRQPCATALIGNNIIMVVCFQILQRCSSRKKLTQFVDLSGRSLWTIFSNRCDILVKVVSCVVSWLATFRCVGLRSSY